jgi:predicted Zn-dependent protease
VERAYRLNVARGFFYPNPMLQDYVNALGQSMVPKGSDRFYAFRIVRDPQPDAWALSTGSIYVTTGLMAMLDNEAQLAYVLAHEIGHVEHRHAFMRERGRILETLLEVEKAKSARRKAAIFGAIAAGLGAGIGAAAGGGEGAAYGAVLGGLGGVAIAQIAESLRQPKFTEWSDLQEKDADSFAAQAALEHNFDVREAPKIFVALEGAVRRDERIGLAFHYGHVGNLSERRQHVQTLLTGTMKASIDQRSGLQATSPNFNLLMATLKRDNGILALEYDLFDVARKNLEEAVAIRSSDPVAHFYLGRAYKQTARGTGDDQKAIDHFLQAIRYDTGREFYPDPHLEHALALLKRNDPAIMEDAQKELKRYVELYQARQGGAVPAGWPISMSILYDYLSLTGDDKWSVPQVVYTLPPARRDPALVQTAQPQP